MIILAHRITFFCFFVLGVFVCTTVFGSRVTIAADAYPIKAVGNRHTIVLFSNGTVVGWGPCDSGELGPIAAVPQRRNWATAPVSIKLPRKAIDVAAGESGSLALLDDGTIYAWGSNYNGLLGNANVSSEMSNGRIGSENPSKIKGISDVVQISADGQGVLALLKNGTVYAWGEKFKGKFGDGKTPTQIPGLQNITQISAGNWHFLALDAGSHVWVWGENYCGKTSRTADLKAVVQVPELNNVTTIAAGACVSTAIKKDGTIWVWGSNGMGGFGNGQQTEGGVLQFTPRQVSGIRNAVAVSSGGMGRHTLVLLKDGSLRGWGNSDWGQIGAGISGDFQLSPVTPKIAGVKAVFAVQNYSFAVKTDDTFWIWGGGNYAEFPLKINAKIPKMLELKTNSVNP